MAQARNRDNQRRSRARRQDYIKELEQRICEHELAGIRATTKVQAAAQKVVNQNSSLRALLESLGVTVEQVDQFLQNGTRPPNGPYQTNNIRAPLQSSESALKSNGFVRQSKPTSEAFATGRGDSLETQSGKFGNHAPYLDVKPSTPIGQFEDQIDVLLRADELTRPWSLRGHDSDFCSQDETSCFNAAQIIASMRGLTNSHEVLPELGCSNNGATCSVKNVIIFQMADR
ncbi:MAG: hypothetical protein MMC23_001951 [Stictis urceolatum]|nr:hypothetical protein [Stictis urceolata]